MYKHELHMQMCDVRGGTREMCNVLSFVCLASIPRTDVLVVYLEEFIIKVAVD